MTRRDAAAFVAELVRLGPGYVPEWRPGETGADAALLQIAARQLETAARRLERVPDKNKLAFLELLGTRLIPAQPSRAPLVFTLAEEAADVALAASTRVAAPAPPGTAGRLAFETETATGLAAARLRDVLVLWPGRDQYADLTDDFRAGRPLRLFERRRLKNTPHAVYIGHDRLLALAGASSVTVTFDLTTPSSEFLDIRWEYWDGKVWRPFKAMRPACSNADAEQLDTTRGLRASGFYRLETDCAETATTTVGDVETYWIRGLLEETLPADPGRVLPEVESIRLQTQVSCDYGRFWTADAQAASAAVGDDATLLQVRVLDATGVPLEGVTVFSVERNDSDTTGDDGRAVLEVEEDRVNTIGIGLGGLEQREPLQISSQPVELTFTLDMPALDRGAFDGEEIDLSKPFYPLGLQPQPGAALYFSHAEAFAKPGALLRLYIQPASTAQDDVTPVTGDTVASHVVSWEYWNGRGWESLHAASRKMHGAPDDFRELGFLDLVVPDDMAPTTVADREGLWLRARLVSGAFGFTRTLTTDVGTVSFFVSQPPALADLRLGYAWQDGPAEPACVLAFNDFRHEDRTRQAVWPGDPFQPFVPVADPTPALYLGFDGDLPVDSLGLYVDVVEQPGVDERPALVWEYWDGLDWDRVPVDDETRDLRVPGIVRFIAADDMQSLARFGTERHWLRARLNEDGPPGEPVLAAVHPNAVWASQWQTVRDEPVGSATGQANQVLQFRQVPVLPGQSVEVRELAGRRANVEWRILATELLGRAPGVISGLEDALAAEGEPTDVVRPPLRLRRDRHKQVTEAWVHWEERPALWFSRPGDRHYAMDRARGRLLFGDGEHGRVPPPGAPVIAREYRSGGGSVANVATRKIDQVLGPVGGIEGVFNAAPAEGGADAETPEQVGARGPRGLRHRGRAVTAGDYEALALQASPSVAVARALPGADPAGAAVPGWVTVTIIPHSAEPRPQPTFGLREHVRRFLAARAPADLVAADQVFVTGPRYHPVDVSAILAVTDITQAGAVERAAHAAIAAFLHPLRGGPAGRGWEPGQPVSVSDLAAVVEGVDGVDHARELGLVQNGVVQGVILPLAGDRMPVAGEIRLRLEAA